MSALMHAALIHHNSMSPEQLRTRERSRAARHAPRYATQAHGERGISTVAVVGLGYVGLPLALLAASRGLRVVGFDIDEVKVAQLARREADFLDEEASALFERTATLSVTADERDLAGADAFIVCVPTPVHEDHVPDLSPLKSACATVGRHLSGGALVVIESTVNPGVCEDVVLPILEHASGLSRADIFFAHCPERVNPGDERFDVRVIPRVLGALNEASLERAHRLYARLLDAEVFRMHSIKEAEAVKMVENAFRDINIAFVNELAIAFDRAGIDLVNVIRGASTKPFGFMPFYPGCGVGGHCIPIDPYYLIRYGRENGFEHTFLIDARRINNRMPLYTVRVLERALKEQGADLSGAEVAVLGLAYKRDIPDVRESPALFMRVALEERGARVRTYDPYAPGGSARTLTDALTGADAAIIATDHAQFRSLSPLSFEAHGVGIVIDGRNCLDKASFERSDVLYRGIGRG